MTIISLEALKIALGIDADDDTEDDALTQFEAQASAWVEAQTHRRFSEPEEVVEYHDGTGTRLLYLNGHVDGADDVVVVRERADVTSEWEAFTDFERRKDVLRRTDGLAWSRSAEYEVTYDDGYATAPADVQALVAELVGVSRTATTSTAGLTSRALDGYKETFDLGAVSSAQNASAIGQTTLNRWRRRFA